MKYFLTLTIIVLIMSACKSPKQTKQFEIIITDTTNNSKAKWDVADFNYRCNVEQQLGLSDLRKGADSLEIRLWWDFQFGYAKFLYTLKFYDTNCLVTYYRIWLKPINDEVEQPLPYEKLETNWGRNPFTNPIIDSATAKSVVVPIKKLKQLNTNTMWLLKSQSELTFKETCFYPYSDGYIAEIADKKRLKYLRHYCVDFYYKETKNKAMKDFMDFCWAIERIARDNGPEPEL